MVSALVLLPLTIIVGVGALWCPNTNLKVDKIHRGSVPLDSYVTYAEYYSRPLSSGSSSSGRRRRAFGNYRLRHVGVVVTTDCCGRWLIDKGKKFGHENYYEKTFIDTVARPWDTMMIHEGNWSQRKCGVVRNRQLWQFLLVGLMLHPYNVFAANCQHAANNIWKRLISYDTSCC